MSTQIQKIIELTVTNGRGYMNFREAIHRTNRNIRGIAHITLSDVLDSGLIPLYHGEKFHVPKYAQISSEEHEKNPTINEKVTLLAISKYQDYLKRKYEGVLYGKLG